MPSQPKFIDAQDFPLEDWLKVLLEGKKKVWPSNAFPNDRLLKQYIERIHDYQEKEVRDLLRILLPKAIRTGHDNEALNFVIAHEADPVQLMDSSEYWRRNFQMKKDVWEGLTWILDLLPNQPKEAIAVVNAYMNVHQINMTDQQAYGLADCRTIIRAKYQEKEHPREVLLGLDPLDFELLVEALYREMGFETELTPRTGDGGVDIIAQSSKPGQKTRFLIQCKRYSKNVKPESVRAMYGVVSRRKCNKGIVVATSDFTRTSKAEADKDDILELVNFTSLVKLLNENLGTDWPSRLDRLVCDGKRRMQPTIVEQLKN